MKNKGFSLVELIIVIAIMAILVGVMAPVLIKYIEKTNVSSDAQFCDTIKEAINISRSDPDIRTDDDSMVQIDYLEQGNLYGIDLFTNQTLFTDNIEDIIGADIIGNGSGTGNDNITKSRAYLKSKVAKKNGILMIQMDGNNIYVWIDHSDSDGGDDNNTCSSFADLADSGVIYVK